MSIVGTIAAYFPHTEQQASRPAGAAPDSPWYRNPTLNGDEVIQDNHPRNDSWTALDFALYSHIETPLKFQIPSSSHTAPHNSSRTPEEFLAASVQYLPSLATQHIEYYKSQLLTEPRRQVLLSLAQDSVQLDDFRRDYKKLQRPRNLKTNEQHYKDFNAEAVRVACELAEMIDRTLFEGPGGWEIDFERKLSNVEMDQVLTWDGQAVVAIEVKQLTAGNSVFKAIENLFGRAVNVPLGTASDDARDALRKMGIHLLCPGGARIGLFTEGASAMLCQIYRSPGSTRPILLLSERFLISSRSPSFILLIAGALLNLQGPEVAIEGVADLSQGSLAPSTTTSTSFPRASTSTSLPPASRTRSSATTATSTTNSLTISTPIISDADRKVAFEGEFGVGAVIVMGERFEEDGTYCCLEVQTAEGPLLLYGEEKSWLEGRELLPMAGKFCMEDLNEAQHLTIIKNFAVFSPTNLQQLTRVTLSHGQLTPPTTPPKSSLPSLVLALSSIISRTINSTIYATSIQDLVLTVKKLSKRQKELALREANINIDKLSNLASDIVPKFFGIFSDEEESYYLIFEYAGKSLPLEELSPSESTTLYSRLEALHLRGILHGDFEGRNVVVGSGETDRRTVKIIDFGYSKMHKCEGEECSELREAKFQLGLSQEI